MGYRIWSEITGRDEDEVDAYLQDWKIITDELDCDFINGVSVADRWPKVIYDVTSEHTPVDAFKSGVQLIVSKRMALVIAEYVPSTDVEFLPVTVNFKGKPYGEYCILHPLVIADALDKNQSEFELFKGNIRYVDKLALEEDKLQGKPLVELNTSQWLLCVSDELASAIEKAGFHGVVFPTPEKWRPY